MSFVRNILLITFAAATVSVRAQDAPTTAPATSSTTQPALELLPRAMTLALDVESPMRRAAKVLIDDAVKKPYGWAWEAAVSGDPRVRRNPPVAMGSFESPAAALALLWAGHLLNDETCNAAAQQVARGVIAAQSQAGAVIRRPTFGASGSGRDDRAYLPNRDATIAGMALLLAQLPPQNEISGDTKNEPTTHPNDAMFRAGVTRSMNWLIKQQAHNGGWPVAFPPNADSKFAVRILRFDNPNFRDATIALFLAGEVMHNQRATEAAKRAADLVLRCRLSDPLRSANLWAAAYTIEGVVVDESLTFPGGADTLASRYALETLLLAACLTDDSKYDIAMDRAAKALSQNRMDAGDFIGKWDRFPEPGLVRAPAATQSSKPGIPLKPAIMLPIEPADFGIASLLQTLDAYKRTKHSQWIAAFADDGKPDLRGRCLAMCCGLIDSPFDLTLIDTVDGSDTVDLSHQIAALLKPTIASFGGGIAR